MRATIAGLAMCFFAVAASGQEQPGGENAGFPVERLRPSLDRSGIIDVESGAVGEHLQYDLSLWGWYALNPLTLSRRSEAGVERAGVLVGHRVATSLVGALSLIEWMQVGAELPLVLYQGRGTPPAAADAVLGELSAVGVGDIRVVPKFRVLRRQDHLVDLAIITAFTVPTALPAQSYMGEGFFTFVPELALSTELYGVRLAANAGMRFRPQTDFVGLDVSHELLYRAGVGYDLREQLDLPLEVNASIAGATALLSPFADINQNPLELLGGAAWDVFGPIQVFGGLGWGLVAGFGTPDLRVFAGVRYGNLRRDADDDGILDEDDACKREPEDKDQFQDSDGCPDPDNDADGVKDLDDRCPNLAGVPEQQGCPADDVDGDGILNDADKCKDDAEDVDGFEDEDGCPDLDNDQDGVLDSADACPNDAEDQDGFEDADGCPEPDNDQDGILDADDKCVNEPEDKDGFRDADGCPEPDNDEDGLLDNDDECPDQPEDMDGDEDSDGCPDDTRIVVTKSKVEILETIHFELDKATIKPESFSILRDVAKAIQQTPPEARIRVEGHTDSAGSEGYNLLLSQRRAESVRDFLIKAGVPKDKLEAKGYGETDPIATNDTTEGRAKNRRVVFRFLGAGE